MSRTQKLTIAAVAAFVVAGLALWLLFFRDTSPPPLSLEGAVSAATATTETPAPAATAVPTTAATAVTPTTAAAASDPAPATSEPATDDPPEEPPAGEWTLDQAGSIVGYRIEEELAGFGGNTAVGRTSQVTGSIVLDGAQIGAVDVVVDMTTLESDDSRRDGQLRNRGLQTSQFPEASFTLDEPIALDEVPAVGEVIQATATGTLTLHGVSRQIAVALEAQLVDNSTIVVVGGVEVALADYDIEPPTGFSVLSVDDTGVFEFQLTFRA